MSPSIVASGLGSLFQPLYQVMAWLLAVFYAVIPNYAVAIALLTVAVMLVTAPLTVKSTKSMLAMAKLQPEIKKLQQKYKNDRATLNEELMRLYREHNANPASGCLPLIIQMPVFFVLYGVIRGLTNTVPKTVAGHVVTEHGKTVLVAAPRYIGHTTTLYKSLVAHPGQMKALGINLADKVTTPQSSWVAVIPFVVLIVLAIGLQYLQMQQMNKRNPAAAQANPQMQAMQKYMPLIFAVIYVNIQAGVNLYFIVSALCRIGIQEWTFRSGVLERAPVPREEAMPGRRGRRTLMDRLAEAQQRALEQQRARDEQRRQAAAGSTPLAAGEGIRPRPPRGTPRPATGGATPPAKPAASGNGSTSGTPGTQGGRSSGARGAQTGRAKRKKTRKAR